MVHEICKDVAFLTQKADAATVDDLGVAQDLPDIWAAHKDGWTYFINLDIIK